MNTNDTNVFGTLMELPKQQVFAAEAALNWKAENAAAQSRALQRIEKNQQSLTEQVSYKLSTLESLIFEIKAKI